MPRKPPLDPATAVDPLSDLLGYQLRRASTAMMASLVEDLAPTGLSVVEASVLLVIADTPGATQSAVGRVLDIHRANMVPLTSKLVALGLLAKEAGAGRATALTVTARGRAVSKSVRTIMRRHDARMLPALSPASRRKLLSWLRALWNPPGKHGG